MPRREIRDGRSDLARSPRIPSTGVAKRHLLDLVEGSKEHCDLYVWDDHNEDRIVRSFAEEGREARSSVTVAARMVLDRLRREAVGGVKSFEKKQYADELFV